MAIAKKSDIDAGCKDKVCTQAGKDAATSGQTLGWISTAGFAAGAIGIGAGIILLVTDHASPPAASATSKRSGAPRPVIALSPRAGSVAFEGSF
jgi:hypothetical protein